MSLPARPHWPRTLRYRYTSRGIWTLLEYVLETMRRRDGLYRIGAIVAHNGPGVDRDLLPAAASVDGATPVSGAGSCIFLHVWNGPRSTTAGCTAMADPALAEILAWLRADADPVLVQLPAGVRRGLQARWALPE